MQHISQARLREEIAQYFYLQRGSYFVVVAYVIRMLDYLDTLPMEITAFWSPSTTGFTASRIMFFISRYMFMLSMMGKLWFVTPGAASDSSCAGIGRLVKVIAELAGMGTHALLVLRAYVVWDQNHAVFALGMTLVFARAVVTLYCNTLLGVGRSNGGKPFLGRCVIHVTALDNPQFEIFELVIPLFSLVLDTLVFALVLYKTLGHAREMRKHGQVSITRLMVRDGTVYFFIMVAIAVCSVAASMVPLVDSHPSSGSRNLFEFITPFFDTLPNILTHRVVLNLRTYSDPELTMPTVRPNDGIPRTVDFALQQTHDGTPMQVHTFKSGDEDQVELDGAERFRTASSYDRAHRVMTLVPVTPTYFAC